jgi:sec-independent protein translocase protein TatB
MGGLGPGIGGFEILVIGIVALLVVGPKDLPLLMRKIGKVMGRARAMANEFRSSFDEMARQSELDELRKEVEALRTGQGMVPLGAEADAAFREIRDDLNRPLDAPPPMLAAPDEWPDSPPVMTPLEAAPGSAAEPASQPKPDPKAKAAAKPRKTTPKAASATAAAASTAKTAKTAKTASGKPRPIRARKIDL